MNSRRRLAAALVSGAALLALGAFVSDRPGSPSARAPFDRAIESNAAALIAEGRQTFRFDTFGDEAFWGDLLQLHRAIAGEGRGGIGAGLSPSAALGLGLKVDVDALPRSLRQAILEGRIDLDDPGVTVELLRLNAVLGVTGFFTGDQLTSVGIQCALCHSTVDDQLAQGIGRRLDGWANRDLDVGTIISLAPNLTPFVDLLGVPDTTVVRVLRSWGPGKFDAELILDGKAFRPDGGSAATLIPPAFGLAGVNLHTWTGWGSVTHWNAFVSNLEMHGKGTFYDPRLNDAARFPIAAREGFGNVRNDPDLITPKLAALHAYQLVMPAPKPPDGTVELAAANRGKALFSGKAECATCHVPPIFTEPGWNMHTPEEMGIDNFQAERSPDRRYRTAPLKGLWTHTKGGFYHDGRFATLAEVFAHYENLLGFSLSDAEAADLEAYLMSLGDATVPTRRTARDADGDAALRLGQDNGELRLLGSQPSRGRIVVELARPVVGPLEAGVYNVAGRRVGSLEPEGGVTGSPRLAWDGTVDGGRRAAAGVYFIRVEHAGGAWSKRVILVEP